MRKGVLLNRPPTQRGLEVLGLFARGLGGKEVARELGISYYTVNWHLRALFFKLKANSVAHAVTLAVREGYLKLPLGAGRECTESG